MKSETWISGGTDRPRNPEGGFSDQVISLTAKPSLIEAIGISELRSQDRKASASAALTYLRKYLKSDTSLVCFDEEGQMKVVAATGPHVRRLTNCKFTVGGRSGDPVLSLERPVNVPDISSIVADGENFSGKLAELGVRSVLAVPIGEYGLIVLGDPRINAFTSFDEAGVSGVAVQLQYIVENKDKSREMKGSIHKLKDLLDSISKAQSTGNLEKAMKAALAVVVDWAGAENGSFMLYDSENAKLTAVATAGRGDLHDHTEVALGEGIAGWVAAHKKPLHITDLNDWQPGRTAGENKLVNAISLPIFMGKSLIGVLNVGSKDRDHRFDLDDLKHITNAMARIGVGMAAEHGKSQWRALYFETIERLAGLIESRNPNYTGSGHRVGDIATGIAKALGLTEGQVLMIKLAALLRDIGVAAFPENLPGREGPLNTAERIIVRNHPSIAQNALSDIKHLENVLPIIKYHHEHYDGTGYSEGLKGENIPLGARILAVADAYVAMTSDRPYRPARLRGSALEEIRSDAGTKYDPKIVATLLEVVKP